MSDEIKIPKEVTDFVCEERKSDFYAHSGWCYEEVQHALLWMREECATLLGASAAACLDGMDGTTGDERKGWERMERVLLSLQDKVREIGRVKS